MAGPGAALTNALRRAAGRTEAAARGSLAVARAFPDAPAAAAACARAATAADAGRQSCRASSDAAAVDRSDAAERPARRAVRSWRPAQRDGQRPAAVRQDVLPRARAPPDVRRPATRR